MLHFCESLGKTVIKEVSTKTLMLPYVSKGSTVFIDGKDFCVEYFATAPALFFSKVLLPGKTPVSFDFSSRSFIIPRSFFIKNGLIPTSTKYGKLVAKEMVFEVFSSFITNEPKLQQKHIINNDMPVLEEDMYDFSLEDYKEAVDFFANTWSDRNYILRFFDTKEAGIAYVIRTPLPVSDEVHKSEQQLALF